MGTFLSKTVLFQVSTSVCGTSGSTSRLRSAAWPSAPTWARPTAVSPLVRSRTWTTSVRLRGRPNTAGGFGAMEILVNHQGGVPACPAAPIQCWPSPTPSMKTSPTARTVGSHPICEQAGLSALHSLAGKYDTLKKLNRWVHPDLHFPHRYKSSGWVKASHQGFELTPQGNFPKQMQTAHLIKEFYIDAQRESKRHVLIKRRSCCN